MQLDLESWLQEYLRSVRDLFGDRIWFLGLQGNYARGEATQNSDIDVVLILDQAAPQDLLRYSAMLDQLPLRDKVCGFVSGKEELFCWEGSDLFQFCQDTKPLYGSLAELWQKISPEDCSRAVKIGLCNLYHMGAHNLIHEKDAGILRGLYKTALFTLRAMGYQQTGVYARELQKLEQQLAAPSDQEIFQQAKLLKTQPQLAEEEFEQFSGQLLVWASHHLRT